MVARTLKMNRKYIFCSLLWMLCWNIESSMASSNECTASVQLSMEACTHEVFQGSLGWDTRALCDRLTEKSKSSKCMINTTINNNNNNNNNNKSPCMANKRVSVFDQQLFSITMKNTFIQMLGSCCDECASCAIQEIEDTMYVNSTILQSSDIIFPVLGEASVEKLHGFYFLPSYAVPTSYYFTLRKSSSLIVGEVIVACLGLWPFLLICLLFAFISGFVVWAIEHRGNRDDFPSRFYAGIFDGFWWSFVSMTTVGYGDKVTKTVVGKMYAVFWILIGITMCSMFTATLTSEIINARAPANTEMAGKDIAVMKGRSHDIQIVADQGGVLRIGTIGHTMRGIEELIDLLENKTVQGFLIDRNTHYHFNNRIEEGKYKYIGDRIKHIDMVRTEKVHTMETLSCGMLIRNLQDYNFFKAYFDNNRLDIRSCNSMRLNTKDKAELKPSNMFGSDSEIFTTVLIYSVSIVGAMMVVGLVVEGKRYYFQGRHAGDNDNEKIALNS